MPGMQADDAAARAVKRDLVRRGYDLISAAYRSDDGPSGRRFRGRRKPLGRPGRGAR